MSKLFNIRLPDALLTAIEAARERFGEKNNSEAVRRLIERGLDPLWDRGEPIADVAKGLLLGIVGKYHQGAPLNQMELKFLALSVHDAFLSADRHRSYVSGELVRQTLEAFKQLLNVRFTTLGIEEQDSDGYFRSKLSINRDESLRAGTERIIRTIGKRCSSSQAEYLSRPFATFVRDDSSKIPTDAMNDALNPYLKSLLLLSIKAYNFKYSQPLISQSIETLVLPEGERGNCITGNKRISMQAFNMGNNVNVCIDFGDVSSALLTLSTPSEIQDFFELLDWASSDSETSHAKAGVFELHKGGKTSPQSMLIIGRVRFFFLPEILANLKDLADQIRETRQLSLPLERLQFAYGLI